MSEYPDHGDLNWDAPLKAYLDEMDIRIPDSATATALSATIATPLNDPDDARGAAMIVHDAGAKLVTIRGAIRNSGAGATNDDFWLPIVDGNHQCDVGVTSITTGAANININFNRDLGKRVSCAVTPDNDMVAAGFRVGASFSSAMLQLTLKRVFTLTDELTWDGAAWTWAQGGRFVVASDSGGTLTITHEAIKGRGMSLTPRAGSGGVPANYLPVLSNASGATTSTTEFKIKFLDFAGAAVTARTAAEADNLCAVVSRTWEGAVNPQTDLTDDTIPLHNIWFEATAHLTDDDADA